MNKKAIFNPVEIMFYIICVMIVAVFIALVTFDYLNEEINTTHLETFLLTKKLVSSSSCLAYQDDIKVYPGITDLEKLNNNRLSSCFTKLGFGYFVKISDINNNIIKTAANLNQEQKSNLKICKQVSRHKCVTRRDLVQYYDGEIKTGYIDIEVINRVG